MREAVHQLPVLPMAGSLPTESQALTLAASPPCRGGRRRNEKRVWPVGVRGLRGRMLRALGLHVRLAAWCDQLSHTCEPCISALGVRLAACLPQIARCSTNPTHPAQRNPTRPTPATHLLAKAGGVGHDAGAFLLRGTNCVRIQGNG